MRNMRGYTLLEMMIVIIIMGVLASIAYPSYQENVRKSKRASAQTALVELAHFMERHYTTHGRYMTTDERGPGLPFETVPRDASMESYRLAAEVDTFGYTLVATPVNDMLDDKCGQLALTNQGFRSPADCW